MELRINKYFITAMEELANDYICSHYGYINGRFDTGRDLII